MLTEMQLNPKEQGLIDVIQSNSWRSERSSACRPYARRPAPARCLDEPPSDMADQEDVSRTKARIAEQIERKKKQLRGNFFDISSFTGSVCAQKFRTRTTE